PPPPPCRGNCGSTIGDPHYTTLDGLYYDFQGAGEYTLIRSTDGQFVVQTRMQPWRASSSATVNTGVATQVGSQRINVLLPNVLVIDGAVVEGTSLDLTLDGGRLTRSGNAISIFWDTGDFISVSIPGDHINVRAQPDPLRAGQVSGLLGNFNGDPMDDISTADGVVLNQPIKIDELYGVYSESWRITQAESLFDYGPGEFTDTFTDPNFPLNRRTPEQLFTENPQAAAQAAITCQGQGITDPILLIACQLDVFVTGDPGFATGFTDESTVITPEVAAEIVSVIDTVNTLDDENGENPESCSLREAIVANNIQDGFGGCVNPEGTITFDPSLNGGTITLTAAPPQITQNVVIDGPGSDSLMVSGNNQFRVFEIGSINSPVVTIQGLTITQGLASNSNGGGILSTSFRLLTIDSVIISNSTATGSNTMFNFFNPEGQGGGISADSVTVSNSTLSGNSANNGGGIHASSATVSNSTLSGNSTVSDGGGIYAFNTATVSDDSTLSGNSAYRGGGIYARFGSVVVGNSTLSGNSARSSGGGIFTRNSATVSNSTLSGNSAYEAGRRTNGGGIYAGTATVSNSTLSGNNAYSGGGGIHTRYLATVSHSTLSGNSAGSYGGGIHARSIATVSNSTLSDNSAGSSGGGIYTGYSSSVVMSNSILSDNSAGSSGGGIYARYIATVSNSTFSGNSASSGGGGIYAGYDSSVAVSNSTLS
ncbi:MAG: VWD domain-containing protein, partial [Cyanophyceae cyanobacterium]